jgi:hypothetical protein
MESEYRGRIIGLKMESEYRGRIIGPKIESEYRGRIIGLKIILSPVFTFHLNVISLNTSGISFVITKHSYKLGKRLYV